GLAQARVGGRRVRRAPRPGAGLSRRPRHGRREARVLPRRRPRQERRRCAPRRLSRRRARRHRRARPLRNRRPEDRTPVRPVPRAGRARRAVRRRASMTGVRPIVERRGRRYCEFVGRLCVAVAAAAALAAGVASGALIPPTGDHAASAFYKQEADKYALLPGARIVETGYFFGRPVGSSVSYMWGRPPATGYRPQTADILVRLYRGRIVAYAATLTAPKMRRVRIVMAGSSVYVTSGKCWNRAGDASSPLGMGEMYLFNDGGTHFLPLVKDGASK